MTMMRTLIDRLGGFQKNLRAMTGLLPTAKLPLLTAPEASGPELIRFKDASQSLASWVDKQVQWWSFSGRLQTTKGRPYAFQIRFVDHRTQNDFFGAVPARWLTPRAFAAQFSLSDPMSAEPESTFRYAERGGLLKRRSGFSSGNRFHIEVGGWSAYERDDKSFSLSARFEDVSLNLDLRTVAPLAYHGQSGYLHGDSSFFCSHPRLQAKGSLISDDRLEDVAGVVWFDHEKRKGSLAGHGSSSDRIGLQFETKESLMIFDRGAATFATWIDVAGHLRHLAPGEVEIANLEYWISPHTGARYPLKRRVKLPVIEKEFEIRPLIEDQEVDLLRGCAWEGAVAVPGATGFMSVAGKSSRRSAKALDFFLGDY